MRLTLAEAALAMIEAVDDFDRANKEYWAVTFETNAAYVVKRDAYIRTRRALNPASRNLNDALGRERTREAAEAGSPGAGFFAPSTR